MSAELEYTRDEQPVAQEWSAAESDHRIANSLSMVASLVRLQAGAAGRGEPLAPQEARAMLEEVAARIDAVGRLHRALAAAPIQEMVDASDYLRDICILAQKIFDPEGRLSICYELAEGARIPASRMAALGLIVNEAVVNSIKYAHPTGVAGSITLVCRPVFGDSLLVTVEDDGVGLPDAFDQQNDGGMGFRIMRSLADQLGATLTCRSSPLGLTMQVLFAI